jgi:BirA family biotin operon repressor/biotin-[acetyl-CoA-carboxylase] ligase
MNATPELAPFYRLLTVDRIGSTSEEAKRLAATGAPEGTLVWALQQTSGHGRRGRVWVSPPGNLYMSVVLRPDCAAGVAAQLGFVAALAIDDAVRRWLAPEIAVALKWPNDVLLDGAKVSGILLESELSPDGTPAWVVLGIGINLASAPDGTDYPATSLAAKGQPHVTAGAMLETLADAWLAWYEEWRSGEGFAAVRRAWLARAHPPGTPLRVRLEREEMLGRFAGLEEDGALMLDTQSGRLRIGAGDVFFPALRA